MKKAKTEKLKSIDGKVNSLIRRIRELESHQSDIESLRQEVAKHKAECAKFITNLDRERGDLMMRQATALSCRSLSAVFFELAKELELKGR